MGENYIMKTARRISVFLIVLICLALSFSIILIDFGNLNVASANQNVENKVEQEEPYVSVEDSVEYFLGLFEEFRNSYVDESGNRFTANYCEFTDNVLVYPGEKEGVYLDFDGENGFAIVTDSYTILKLQLYGDYPDLRNRPQLNYNLLADSFVSDEGFDLVFEEYIDNIDNNKCKSSAESIVNNVVIEDVDSYIRGAYANLGYEVEIENYAEKCANLDYCEWDTQFDTSLYAQEIYVDGRKHTYGEGNCSLHAGYITLSYMRNSGHMPNLPKKGNTYIEVSLDPVYYLALSSGYYIYNDSLPTMYYQMRKIAVDKYGYTYDGFSAQNLLDVMREIRKQYGYSSVTMGKVLSSPIEQTDYYLEDNNPYLIELINNPVYKYHMAVVYGYKLKSVYTKYSGFRILLKMHGFFTAHNGHDSDIRYIDYTNLEYDKDYKLYMFI